ncbi:hypothetical protein Ae201684P_015033 [Aphanomyces euteiches]|uniref:Uncharacterized protein n=1 Tax=Aphanomyces euteiches TaxID=100861 RepID=A0A6G0XHE0_9STRA|nr:hypothetical protein Ae201684_004789 [Aphanomyces euteiches]KAH9073216.1 hypothetical protein Ae201684P_015033 [Aphanomyces euteiches]
MKASSKRKKTDKEHESDTPTKKSFLLDYQREELVLEREKVAFEREKLMIETQEKERDREERKEVREEQRKHMEQLLELARSCIDRSLHQ